MKSQKEYQDDRTLSLVSYQKRLRRQEKVRDYFIASITGPENCNLIFGN
jgi:hypothetical protein